jgi:hypothetical protein
MPGSFPAAAPTLSGDVLSVSRFLQNPANIARRLRTFRDLRFVSDQLLTGRFRVVGGAIVYEQSESQVTDRTVDKVNPGAVYPYASVAQSVAAMAAVAKWGQKTFMADEEIKRNVFGGAAVDRNLRKVVNSIIKQVDGITMSGITSAVTATYSVTAGGGIAWNLANALFLRDILRAKAAIVGLNQGYMPNTLALNDVQYAYLMSDEKFTNALKREDSTNPIYTGEIERVAGLTIVVSPSIVDPIVLDNNQLGGMADETDVSPGYAVSDQAIEVKSIRLDGRDGFDLQGRRLTVPVVQEPGSAIRLTNTGL